MPMHSSCRNSWHYGRNATLNCRMNCKFWFKFIDPFLEWPALLVHFEADKGFIKMNKIPSKCCKFYDSLDSGRSDKNFDWPRRDKRSQAWGQLSFLFTDDEMWLWNCFIESCPLIFTMTSEWVKIVEIYIPSWQYVANLKTN